MSDDLKRRRAADEFGRLERDTLIIIACLAIILGMLTLAAHADSTFQTITARYTEKPKHETFKVFAASGGTLNGIIWWIHDRVSNPHPDLPPLYFFKLDGGWVWIVDVVDSLPPMRPPEPADPARISGWKFYGNRVGNFIYIEDQTIEVVDSLKPTNY